MEKGILILVGILVVVFWLMAIVDIINSKYLSTKKKFMWFFIVVVFPFLGTILYVNFGKGKIGRRNIFQPFS